MKDKCIVYSVDDICRRCPDKLVQEVRVERYGLLKLVDPLALSESTKKKVTIPSGKECRFPRAVKFAVKGARVDSIDGLGDLMPRLLEVDIQRNHIMAIDAWTLPRSLSILKLDGNPIERIDNADRGIPLLEELSLANAPGTINIDWVAGLDHLASLNLSNKSVLPPVYRTMDNKIKKTSRKLDSAEINMLKTYIRQYPIEMAMAEKMAKGEI